MVANHQECGLGPWAWRRHEPWRESYHH